MTDYFQKLPNILYDKTPAKNILARADFSKITRSNAMIYYPHTMEDGDRADIIAHNYYEDSDYAWLIYYANEILDPYYDLNINDDNFQNLIEKKYGNISNASTMIKYYKNNWAQNGDQMLSVAGYNALPSNLRKYWSLLVNENYQIIAYARKAADWIVNTNRIVQLNINEIATPFSYADLITNGSAKGVVMNGNTTSITVQHVQGAWSNTQYQVTSRYTNVSANVTSCITIKENLDAAEEVYYSPVTFLDYEEEQNMMKKEIQLIDNRFANKAASDLKRVMSE